MSAPGAPGRRLPSEVDFVPRMRDLDPVQQQLRLRDRQKFFEDIFQHDVDMYFPLNHLNFEHRRPPLDSISSMEVNVDMLEQIETFDTSDQDSLDVFLSSATEDETDVSSLSDFGSFKDNASVLSGDTNEMKSSTELSGADGRKEADEEHEGDRPVTNSANEAKSQ